MAQEKRGAAMDPAFTKTKIVATIGPACLDQGIIDKMVSAGMDCARINTAHGDFSQYESIIRMVREAGNIPIMIDVKGPEIRVRSEKEIVIPADGEVVFGFKKGELPYFSFDFSKALADGNTVFFDNGQIEGKVVEVKKGLTPRVTLHFMEACVIKPNKGVNVPGKKLKMPSLSEKDRESVKFSIKNSLSFIALSFTRHKEDIRGLKKLIGDAPIDIIAKIENQEGIDNIDEIIAESDGIMVARGDLGVEIPASKIPYLQKMIVQKCNTAGKIVIVATQMLESMISSPKPTRAEVSDVANAVVDGADAVMLSGETAAGKYPVKAVEAMRDIGVEMEDKIIHHVQLKDRPSVSDEVSAVAAKLAVDAKATKIVCITRSGFTARLISRFRPNIPLIAMTNSKDALLQMKLVWGVMPIMMEAIPTKAIMPTVADYLFYRKMLDRKDLVVFVGGIRTLQPSVANVVEIHSIGDLLDYKKKYIEWQS